MLRFAQHDNFGFFINFLEIQKGGQGGPALTVPG